MNTITVVSNDNTQEFFVSEKHSDYELDDFAVCTYSYPHEISPRKGFEDGILKTAEDIIALYYEGYTDITDETWVQDLFNE